jgi:hypothetical protein
LLDQAIETVRRNPYLLAKDIYRITFKTADQSIGSSDWKLRHLSGPSATWAAAARGMAGRITCCA